MIASDPTQFPVLVPESLDEAVRQRAQNPTLMPVAGGTEVMVLFNEGMLTPRPIQSLHKLSKLLRTIRETSDGGIAIGAMATYTDVRHHARIASSYPLLVESARVTGALQIQNRGTLAGNIVNASPAADTAPSLMVYGATVKLIGPAGERLVPLSEFFVGYKKTQLRSDELVIEILLPPPPSDSAHQYYRKVGTRAAQAISKVVVAAIRDESTCRIAWGSVAATTVRTPNTEEAIASGASADDAVAILKTELVPMDDIRSTAAYRLAVCGNLLREFLGR